VLSPQVRRVVHAVGLGSVQRVQADEPLDVEICEVLVTEAGQKVRRSDDYRRDVVRTERMTEEAARKAGVTLVPRPPVFTILGHVDHGGCCLRVVRIVARRPAPPPLPHTRNKTNFPLPTPHFVCFPPPKRNVAVRGVRGVRACMRGVRACVRACVRCVRACCHTP
jgi:hypothetical protein